MGILPAIGLLHAILPAIGLLHAILPAIGLLHGHGRDYTGIWISAIGLIHAILSAVGLIHAILPAIGLIHAIVPAVGLLHGQAQEESSCSHVKCSSRICCWFSIIWEQGYSLYGDSSRICCWFSIIWEQGCSFLATYSTRERICIPYTCIPYIESGFFKQRMYV